jgi:SAM-dependent methyltransferase
MGIWDDPDLYDFAANAYQHDVLYWEWLIEAQRPGTVLELACGTGRLIVPMVGVGRSYNPAFRLVGLDSSESFLDRARAKLIARGPEWASAVELVRGDMRDFALDERFDLIVLGFSSIQYLLTIDDQLACFHQIRRHLAPGGRFAFEVSRPWVDVLIELDANLLKPLLEADVDQPTPEIDRYLRWVVGRYDPVTQNVATTFLHEFYRDGVMQERRIQATMIHFFFPCELELLCRIAGLAPVERYGGYNRRPYDERSRLYLWIMAAQEQMNSTVRPASN